MKLYRIGFRSGEEITVNLKDGEKTLLEIAVGMKGVSGSSPCWHLIDGLFLCVSQIEYIVETSLLVPFA